MSVMVHSSLSDSMCLGPFYECSSMMSTTTRDCHMCLWGPCLGRTPWRKGDKVYCIDPSWCVQCKARQRCIWACKQCITKLRGTSRCFGCLKAVCSSCRSTLSHMERTPVRGLQGDVRISRFQCLCMWWPSARSPLSKGKITCAKCAQTLTAIMQVMQGKIGVPHVEDMPVPMIYGTKFV